MTLRSIFIHKFKGIRADIDTRWIQFIYSLFLQSTWIRSNSCLWSESARL